MTFFKKPKVLGDGSVIGIAAASSPFSAENFHKGVNVLESLGFKVKYSEDILSRKKGYLAGSDEVRAAELSAMFSDSDIDAVMFARGGYGIQRILNQVDFTGFTQNPKLVVAYSDLTALTSYLTNQLKTTCFYGPVVAALADENQTTISSLKSALTSDEPLDSISTQNLKIVKDGEASGILLGGCLSMISSSIGTNYAMKAEEDAILFLEDFNEKIYSYDRMLTHLKNSRSLKNVKGIVFGSLGLVENETDEQFWKVIVDVFDDFKGPIVCGISSGHTSPFLTLPLGVKCTIRADISEKPKIIFEESALI